MEKPSSPLKLAVREDSHMVGKSKMKITKPKIRIVHIFAPEIIKTDVANFRDLVQRLTGKPAKSTAVKKKNQKMVVDDEVEVTQTRGRGGWVDECYSDGGLLSVLGEVEGLFQGLTDYPFL